MLIEIKLEFMPESDLEEVVVETFLGNLHFLSRLLQWKPLAFGVAFVIEWTAIIFPPIKHFVNDMTDSSFLRSSTFASLRHLVHTSLLSIVACSESVLESHQSMNHGNTKIFRLDCYKLPIFEILRANFHIFVDWIDPTVHVDAGFVEVKVNLFVWVKRDVL